MKVPLAHLIECVVVYNHCCLSFLNNLALPLLHPIKNTSTENMSI